MVYRTILGNIFNSRDRQPILTCLEQLIDCQTRWAVFLHAQATDTDHQGIVSFPSRAAKMWTNTFPQQIGTTHVNFSLIFKRLSYNRQNI